MPKRAHPYLTVVAGLLLAAHWAVVAGDGTRSPESDLAAPGASLYQYAVSESVTSLMSKQEQAEARPPSPGPDYYWCENHKTYHKGQTPASGSQPAAVPTPGAAPALPQQPGVGTATRPPSPGPGHYWCENCKTYHQTQTNQLGAAQQPGALAHREAPAAGTGDGARPPSPGEGYYWCENCKTYHVRQTSVQQPGASQVAPHAHPAPPADGAIAAQALGQSYYCEQCKTYHRRQPVAQQQPADVHRFGAGVSNVPNWNPLFGPAGAER